jgi:hypothetical protein
LFVLTDGVILKAMNRFVISLLIILGTITFGYGQTCTLSGTGTILWSNASPPACQEGGNAGTKTTIIIPAGVTLEFDNNGDTWTGTLIEVYGTLLINQADIVLYTSLRVRSGGLITIGKKLSLGTSPTNPTGCNFTVIVDSGGTIDVTETGTDRLSICGSPIMKGAGQCNSCGGTNSGTCAYNGDPYCEPTGGFTGPLGYSKDGYDSSLPIELLSFKASKGITNVKLSWATASELNFHYFEVERSVDGNTFTAIGKIQGNGTTNIRQDYSFEDEKPLIGKNYYRLKAVDFDGYTERFNVLMVDYDGKKNFSVYPNPSDGVTLHTETNFVPVKNSFVAIYTSTGAEVGRYIIESDAAELTMPVQLQSGWYYAKFISSEYTSVARILVK